MARPGWQQSDRGGEYFAAVGSVEVTHIRIPEITSLPNVAQTDLSTAVGPGLDLLATVDLLRAAELIEGGHEWAVVRLPRYLVPGWRLKREAG